MWVKKEPIIDHQEKPKRSNIEELIKTETRKMNHFKELPSLRSSDFAQKDIVKMLYRHSYLNSRNTPILYSKYIQNVHEDVRGLTITDPDTMSSKYIFKRTNREDEDP